MADSADPEKTQEPPRDDDDGANDLIESITTLPRVGHIAVHTTVMRAELEEETPAEVPKANIQWRLKPFVPRAKKQMVTMSDLGMNGNVRSGSDPSRTKKKPGA